MSTDNLPSLKSQYKIQAGLRRNSGSQRQLQVSDQAINRNKTPGNTSSMRALPEQILAINRPQQMLANKKHAMPKLSGKKNFSVFWDKRNTADNLAEVAQ